MKNQINKKEILEKLIPVVENTAIRYNLIPIEISFEKENSQWFVRIFIYSNNHEVNHQDCENISRSVGDFLDELIPFKYCLEVSSPGLSRKMKSELEYTIFKGKKIIIKTKEPLKEGMEKKFEATLNDYQKGIGLLITKKDTNEEFTVKLDNIFSVQLNED